ncbi:MAG: peptidoglycan-binding protein [Proteobacteria bacterium]|nr:peptidoglycan-binding protein [Pseudomonadota bacterium]
MSLLRFSRFARASLWVLGAWSCAPALAGSLHADAEQRPFSRPAPLAQELRYKMESPLVRELQVRLRHAKYLALYDVDERYGLKTRETVRKFQKDHGLRPTGIVDQATWDVLLPKSHQPTAAELNNTDVGAWFTGPGQGGYIKELQHRLKQVGHYQGAIDGGYHPATQQAIAGFRAQVGLPASKVMDERTWARLIAQTRNPRYAQLFDQPPASHMTQELDARCLTGKVVCISWEQKKMSLVVDGRALFTREARFARPGWASDKGEFRIWFMNADTVSTIFGERTPMPYAIFYDKNVAIHYSDDFDQVGYEGGSHGCSQLKDYQVAKWLYEQVKVGDKVVVY